MSLLCSLTKCSKVKISDAEIFGDMGELGAAGVKILSGAERDLTKEEWDKERYGMICTSQDNYKEWRANLEKLCKESKLCTYEVKTQMEDVFHNVESVSFPPVVHPIAKP